MKTPLVVSLSIVMLPAARAATAYEALRTVGKERGDVLLDRVIEVRGSGGAPEPGTWKVIVEDREARGGVREFDVRGTRILSERTPAGAVAGKPLDLNQLNLDSDGAHTVAERESKKTAFAYDRVDYSLRAGTGAGAPVWELRLVDDRDGNVATVAIGADSGKLLTADGLNPKRPTRVAESAPVERSARPPEPRTEEEEKRRGEPEQEIDKPGNKLTRFAERAGRHIGGAFKKFGDKVNRAFTGEPKKTPPPPKPASSRIYRDKNGTEYYRPRD